MKTAKLIKAIQQLYPEHYQYHWDNSGPQLTLDENVESIMLCLDFSTEVIAEAKAKGAQFILSHHPLFFKATKQLSVDTVQGAISVAAARAGISLYTMHTNFDNHPEGMGHLTLKALGCDTIKIMKTVGAQDLGKLITFVPREQTNAVAQALGDAGAGAIGDYSHCSFRTAGQGQFLPLDGANPTLGEVGALETVEEDRLEMIFPMAIKGTILNALRQSHPYEEVAFDVIALDNKGEPYGIGSIGTFSGGLDRDAFVSRSEAFFAAPTEHVYGTLPDTIKKIAYLGGVGSDFIRDAARAKVDVYLTGEVRYHDLENARPTQLPIMQLGHGVSERQSFYQAQARIAQATGLTVHTSDLIWEDYG